MLCCRCPPQAWLKGLLALAFGTTIWAIATEDNFRRKLEDTQRWASDEQCLAASFDPCYRLLEGTRASSILDWEAKQFAIAREQNGLVVKRFVGLAKAGSGKVADWYPVPHTATDAWAQDAYRSASASTALLTKQERLYALKQAAPSPSEHVNEEVFNDLLYALKADTFEHGEDSQSTSGWC